MATGTTAFINATTASAFIPTLYSKEAIVAREAALLLANRVNRVFEAELTFGSTLNVPSVSNLSVQNKSTSADAATIFQTITETNTALTVGTWEYQAIALESFTRVQADRNLLATYAPKQGYALAVSVDSAIQALVASFTSSVGVLAQDLNYEDVLRGIQYLDDANAPTSDRWIEVSPAQKAGFMKLDQFVHGDYGKLNGEVNDAAREAMLGSWMTVPVGFSTNVNGSNAAGHNNLIIQKEAIALVVQLDATSHEWFDLNFLAQKVVVEHIYGTQIMRNDHGVNAVGS